MRSAILVAAIIIAGAIYDSTGTTVLSSTAWLLRCLVVVALIWDVVEALAK